MLVEHRGRRPVVHDSAWIAPTAVVCGGDVHVDEDARILWNAVVSAEDGRVELGARYVMIEGEERGDGLMARVMPRQAAWLGAHRDDRVL